MPSTRSDRKRIVRDEEDFPANGSSLPSSTEGGLVMNRQKGSATLKASSPVLNSQQQQQNAAARTANPFNITPEQLMQQYQMLTDTQKAVLTTYSPADQKKLLEQQVAKRIYEKMIPAEKALLRARIQQAQLQNHARGVQSNVMGPRMFFFPETPALLLKKFENEPPSLVLHVHPSHFRFGNQETVIPRNSPLMKVFLEHIAYKAIPPVTAEVFGDSALKFYEGNIILQIVDHRDVPHENFTDKEDADGNKNKKSDEKVVPDSADGQPKQGLSSTQIKKETVAVAKPKIVRTILQPTPVSIWHDSLCTSDLQKNPISDEAALDVESKILKFTVRNVDLTVPKNPYDSHIAPILTNQIEVRKSEGRALGKRTWSEFQTEQTQLQEIYIKPKKESTGAGLRLTGPSAKKTESKTLLEDLAAKGAVVQATEPEFIQQEKSKTFALYETEKQVADLHTKRREVYVKPRKLHEELMQHGSEYEELMLVMSRDAYKESKNAAGQLVRFSFIEQIHKKIKNQQRLRQLRQSQMQTSSGQATNTTMHVAENIQNLVSIGGPANNQNPSVAKPSTATPARPRTQAELLRQQQLQLQLQQLRAKFPQLTQPQLIELLRRRTVELQHKHMDEVARAQEAGRAGSTPSKVFRNQGNGMNVANGKTT